MNSEKHVKQSSAGTPRRAPTSAGSQRDSRLRAEPDSSLKSIAFGVSRGTMENKPLLGVIVLLLSAALLVAGAVDVIRSALDRPDVYRSYTTQECVKVVNADGTAGNCSQLPERYNSRWVE
ncbi:putative membrane protein [Stenotrophomonas phage Sonora]|nr:putative membrane protein [Stenotrophomonas phage Sonora]